MTFEVFSKLVHDQFESMAKDAMLFDTGLPLWETYLAAFPEGTNPIFKTRTEHDCSCCRNFVKNIGHIKTTDHRTVWDTAAEQAPYPFNVVATALRRIVQNARILSVYGASPKHYSFGAQKTYDPANDRNWNHFYAVVPTKHRRSPENIGQVNTTYAVLKRGLEELNILENLDTVIDLINSNSIYRGQEHLAAVRAFRQMVKEYQAAQDKEAYLWAHLSSPQARFRNTVIGTLIVDLCDGVDLERAVASFESKVAPTNYKRPKSLITPKMIDDALSTLDNLGLRDAIDRRFARLSDVSVNDVLFVDNDAKPLMKDGLRDALMSQTKAQAPDVKKAIPITIDELLALKPEHLSLLVENKHMGNFVSMTAPKHPDTGRLFKWTNDFAWSYDGNITDSIKERVKKAGGNVTNAQLRISLSWFNYDDLDLHVREPSGNLIYFANRGGKLDVDMNAGSGTTREAVENVSYQYGQVAQGTYTVLVDNFRRRESSDVGFDLEVEFEGQLFNYSYTQPVGSNVKALTITIKGGSITVKPEAGVKDNVRSHEKWGVSTQTFAPVQALTLSPNYWGDNHVGNKHWFFILKDCKNPDPVRGIYNEFLSPQFETHRKVFEVLGDKTKAEPTPDQMSGLGFSSTLGEEVFVQVNRAQTYKVKLA